ncbi:N-acetyltransferase family protein [Bacteroides sp.]|uniref:GNAT family N-acetyltransferase n=1 Tax=Bacteroides sp. TaxID=29523 RepID=UPI002FC7D168
MKGTIREVRPGDVPDILNIYNYYIKETVITFETELLTEEEMGTRIINIAGRFPYFVYVSEDDGLLGYCYAHTWKARAAYQATVETTVYLRPGCSGQGIGRELMEVLLDSLRKHSFHVAIACITYPNEASIRLHEQLGFRKVAHYDEVGYKLGRLLDVGDWQLIL